MANTFKSKANSFKIGWVLIMYIIVMINSNAATATLIINLKMYLLSMLFYVKSFF